MGEASPGNGNINYEKMQYYYHSDHLGSSSYITNLDGSVVQHIEYVPFGEVFIEERNNTWNTPYLFNGKELDEETGLYYYGARYFNPRESVWLSVDPLAEKYPNVSPYAYTFQNPVNFIDPTGMEGEGSGSSGKVLPVIDPVLSKVLDLFKNVEEPVLINTYTREEYITLWEQKNNRQMTEEQKGVLDRGCVGIVLLEVGQNGTLPNLGVSFSTFDQAQEFAEGLQKYFSDQGMQQQVAISSMRFWTESEFKFLPDAKGRIDMRGYNGKSRPTTLNEQGRPVTSYVRFDFGYYDGQDWWSADYCHNCGMGPMHIYQQNLEHFSRPLEAFNRQIFFINSRDKKK